MIPKLFKVYNNAKKQKKQTTDKFWMYFIWDLLLDTV